MSVLDRCHQRHVSGRRVRVQWDRAFDEAGWSVEVWRQRLALYPPIASAFFDRSRHVIARLRPR